MALLNRILSIVILLVAIGAAFLSYKLFERRNAFRDRAATMATTIVDVVKSLDQDSNTNFAKNVTFTPSDPTSKTPETGTLSWANYHADQAGFNKPLDEAKDLAGKINKQRGFLAENIGQIAIDLEMPEDLVSIDDLKDAAPEKYEGQTQQVIRLTKAVRERDDAMIAAFIATSKTIGFQLNEADLRERKQDTDDEGNQILAGYKHGIPLTEFKGTIDRLQLRCNDYGKTLVDAIGRVPKHEWETDPTKIEDPADYPAALTALMNDFEKINEKLLTLDRAKLELEDVKLKLEASRDELELTREELVKTQEKVADQKIEIARLKQRLGVNPADPNAIGGIAEVNPDLEGKVLRVDRDWSFVIVSLGSAQVQENMEMLVARADELIARIQITKVYSKKSVGEVLSAVDNSPILEGDRVILPKR